MTIILPQIGLPDQLGHLLGHLEAVHYRVGVPDHRQVGQVHVELVQE